MENSYEEECLIIGNLYWFIDNVTRFSIFFAYQSETIIDI